MHEILVDTAKPHVNMHHMVREVENPESQPPPYPFPFFPASEI